MQLNIRERIASYKRILMMAKKPTGSELVDTAKICTVGIIIVGLISFVLYIAAILLAL